MTAKRLLLAGWSQRREHAIGRGGNRAGGVMEGDIYLIKTECLSRPDGSEVWYSCAYDGRDQPVFDAYAPTASAALEAAAAWAREREAA